MAGIIELKNVSFSAQEGNIIQDVSVEFEESKAAAIVGPSGCGKSTLLKLAAGLLVPEQGEVFYKGKNISMMTRHENLQFRRSSAFVFQDSALWANQNLFQILELPLKIHFPEMSEKQRFNQIMSIAEKVGYFKDLYVRPARLSMGEQKIIAFARAIINNPSLFFLDEWTESLDDNTAEWLVRIVRAKKEEGSTILFISHDIRLIMELADYVVVVTEGRMSVKAANDHVLGDLLLNDSFTIGIAS